MDPLRKRAGGEGHLRVVVLLACVLGLDSADKATVGAVAAQLESSLGIGNAELGLLATASTVVGAVLTLPVGMVVDRFHRVHLLAAGIGLWAVAMAVGGASSSYSMLLVSRLFLGAVLAIAGPVVASLVGDVFPSADRGRIYGMILAGELAGAGFGLVVAGDIAGVLSWRWAFWILAVVGLALAAVLAGLLPEPDRGGQSGVRREDEPAGTADDSGEEEVKERIRSAASIEPDRNLVLHEDPTHRRLWPSIRYILCVRTNVTVILASALGYFFFSGLRTFAVVYIHSRYGLGQSAASTVLVLVGLGSIVGVVASGRFADRLIRRGHLAARPVVAGVALLAAAGLFLPGLVLPNLLIAVPLFFAAAAALGAANAPLDAARLDVMHHRLWGRAESVRTVLRSGFEAVAPLLFGVVSELFGGRSAGLERSGSGSADNGAALEQTFLIMLLPLALGGLLLMFWTRRTYPTDVATAAASEDATRARTKA